MSGRRLQRGSRPWTAGSPARLVSGVRGVPSAPAAAAAVSRRLSAVGAVSAAVRVRGQRVRAGGTPHLGLVASGPAAAADGAGDHHRGTSGRPAAAQAGRAAGPVSAAGHSGGRPQRLPGQPAETVRAGRAGRPTLLGESDECCGG